MDRLGVPAVPPTSLFGSGSVVPKRRRASAPPERESVSYVHIPAHAKKDFQRFARNATEAARRATAADNPYVQALRRHRFELQASALLPDESDGQTMEQLMSTEREALALMTPVLPDCDNHHGDPIGGHVVRENSWASLLPCSSSHRPPQTDDEPMLFKGSAFDVCRPDDVGAFSVCRRDLRHNWMP